jgi:membrane protein DedA with SNARE-associated domain
MFDLQQRMNWLFIYKYLVIFPLVILEGPFVSIISGFLSSMHILNIFIVYPVLVIADLVGDIFYYSIGRWGGRKILNKYVKIFRLKESNIKRIEEHFDRHTKKTIIVGKISHAFGAPILIAAGMAKVRIYEIFWSNFVVTIPKYLILLFIGYYFGIILINNADYFSLIMLGLGVLLILIFIIYSKVSKRLDKIVKE